MEGKLLEKIAKVWELFPSFSFTQLIFFIASEKDGDFYKLTNKELLKICDKLLKEEK